MSKTFGDLSLEQKFKAIREDSRLIAEYSAQTQREIRFLQDSIAELRRQLQRLTTTVDSLSKPR